MTKMQKHNPELYGAIKKKQMELEKQFSLSVTIERKCPYCNSTIATVYQGTHAGEKVKCPVCKEIVFLSPVSFRLAR